LSAVSSLKFHASLDAIVFGIQVTRTNDGGEKEEEMACEARLRTCKSWQQVSSWLAEFAALLKSVRRAEKEKRRELQRRIERTFADLPSDERV